jgi:hypothetical protein
MCNGTTPRVYANASLELSDITSSGRRRAQGSRLCSEMNAVTVWRSFGVSAGYLVQYVAEPHSPW